MRQTDLEKLGQITGRQAYLYKLTEQMVRQSECQHDKGITVLSNQTLECDLCGKKGNLADLLRTPTWN